MSRRSSFVLAACFALSSVAFAQPPQGGSGGGPPGGGQHHGPPPAARSACANQAEGASCSFQSPHGQVTGTCRRVPEGSVACVPAHPHHGGHGGPPGGGQGGSSGR
ncbi:MAG: hypothetical protein U0230_17260 [Polyangiales bacterium]